MYSNGPPHVAGQKQDDQLEHTFSSYVRIRDVALKTCQRRWTIERNGERGSGISVLAARHNDDDYVFIFVDITRTMRKSYTATKNADSSAVVFIGLCLDPMLRSLTPNWLKCLTACLLRTDHFEVPPLTDRLSSSFSSSLAGFRGHSSLCGLGAKVDKGVPLDTLTPVKDAEDKIPSLATHPRTHIDSHTCIYIYIYIYMNAHYRTTSLLPAMGTNVDQTSLFNLGRVTDLGEGRIQNLNSVDSSFTTFRPNFTSGLLHVIFFCHCQKIVVSNPTQAGQRFTWSKNVVR